MKWKIKKFEEDSIAEIGKAFVIIFPWHQFQSRQIKIHKKVLVISFSSFKANIEGTAIIAIDVVLMSLQKSLKRWWVARRNCTMFL